MTKSSKVALACGLLLFLHSPICSQRFDLANEKELSRQRQRIQAFSVIRQTATQALLWDNKKAAVQVLADAADLIWDQSPAQGSEWLTKSWTFIEEVSEPGKNEKLREFFNPSIRSELRTAVLAVARKHDAQLADKFLKQLSDKETSDRKERGAFDDLTARSEQLLKLAQRSVAVNPKLAFDLAQSSLSDGISQGLQSVLTSLRMQNIDLANRLFDLALARFVRDLCDPSEAEVLAGYLFRPGFTFSASLSGQTILIINPDQQNLSIVARVEPQRARNFLIAVYERMLVRSASIDTDQDQLRVRRLLVLANHIVNQYNTFAPEYYQSALGFLAHLQRRVAPAEDQIGIVEGHKTGKNNPDSTTKKLTAEETHESLLSELEQQADKESNSSFRNLAYVKAAVATKPADYQRAKSIVEKIDDVTLRTDTLSFLLYRAALYFLEHDDIERAVDLTVLIGDPLRRAVVKIAVAQRSMTLNPQPDAGLGESRLRQQRAFDLLMGIDSDLSKAVPSVNAAKVALSRTAVLARLDQSQALVSLEQAIQIINKLEAFDLKDGSAPDLSVGPSATFAATVAKPRMSFDFRGAIEPVIDANLQQVSAIAEILALKELNGMARLETAKLYLEHNKASSRDLSRIVP